MAIVVATTVTGNSCLSRLVNQRIVLSLGSVHRSLVRYRLDAHVEDIALALGQA